MRYMEIDVSKNYLQMTPHRTITDGNSLTVNIFMTCIWEPVTFWRTKVIIRIWIITTIEPLEGYL